MFPVGSIQTILKVEYRCDSLYRPNSNLFPFLRWLNPFSRLSLSTFSPDQVTSFIEYFNRIKFWHITALTRHCLIGKIFSQFDTQNIFGEGTPTKLKMRWENKSLAFWLLFVVMRCECGQIGQVGLIRRKLEGFAVRLIDIYCGGSHHWQHSRLPSFNLSN